MVVSSPAPARSKKPLYKQLYAQVLVAIAIGIVLGHFWPDIAVSMRPLGDGFIRLIRVVIALLIFCTAVSGIAGMKNMREVGSVGGKALIYFEVVSTLALVIGMIVGNLVRPGDGLDIDPATLDTQAVADYAGRAEDLTITEFLLAIIPETFIGAFAEGDILPVLLVSILFGLALSALGEQAAPVKSLIDSISKVIFGMVTLILKVAPIGAFGAMAFTIGRYGIGALGPLLKLIGTFYLTSILFVFLVLGTIARLAGFRILKLLAYIKEEIFIVLGTSSSDPALPGLMKKLEDAGCSKSLVGLVLPTGYVFNTDGSSIYMTMAALFVAQAMNIDLTISEQLAIFAVAMLTSKGAVGVQGASFIALVATLTVVPSIPVAGMAIILGIDRFMSEARALVNVIGNAVATVVVARWTKELDVTKLNVLR